jgi:prepilin-type N-terminal cleavage/methylation domain-containing protein
VILNRVINDLGRADVIVAGGKTLKMIVLKGGIMKMKKGFTLIELLVVIAIISLLLSIIVPSLKMVKMKAYSALCLNNTKNLSLGWYLYKEDNGDRIMSARMGSTESGGLRVGWIGQPYAVQPGDRTISQVSPPVTDEDEIRGIEQGRLYDYLQTPASYHCPGDRFRKSRYDGTGVFVSYSVPRCLYGYTDPASAYYNKQIRRYSQMDSPSQRYVFVEVAEERNWNEAGWFSLGAPEYTNNSRDWAWWGPMAINHGDSSVLGFADGHSEVHRWQDPFTVERVTKLSRLGITTYDIEFPPSDQVEDISYMARGWAYRNR